jgi:uncharacterized tellurite resistance protein B-like protein
MVIWGSRAVKRRLDAGRFHCPQCGCQQEYELISAQRHGHVYWIPLFRLGQPVEYVECQGCRNGFDPVVLERQPMDREAFAAAFGSAVMASVAAVALADGPASDAELEGMRTAVAAATGIEVSREDVQRVVALDHAGDAASAEGMLAGLEQALSPTGKETIVRALLMTAAADGAFAPEARSVVERLATALDVSPAHLKGIVAELAA